MTDQTRLPTSRRAVFAGASVVGAAALLAACGDDTDPTVTSPTSPGAGATDGAGNGAPAVLGPTSDIPVGGGKIFAEHGVVVTQPAAGKFAAFSSVCTHQSCPLTDVTDGKINCSCHFSAFSITDGSVLNPPATTALAKKEVVVEGDEIHLA